MAQFTLKKAYHIPAGATFKAETLAAGTILSGTKTPSKPYEILVLYKPTPHDYADSKKARTVAFLIRIPFSYFKDPSVGIGVDASTIPPNSVILPVQKLQPHTPKVSEGHPVFAAPIKPLLTLDPDANKPALSAKPDTLLGVKQPTVKIKKSTVTPEMTISNFIKGNVFLGVLVFGISRVFSAD